jgi:hypothetical protein
MTVKLCPNVQIPVRKEVSEILDFFPPVVTLMMLGAREKEHLEVSFRVPKILLLQNLDY